VAGIMTVPQADTWREIIHAERLELYASPERVEWILRNDSLSDGRSILYFPETKTTPGRNRVRKMDEPDEPVRDLDEVSWRKTFEFDGDEESLASAAD
jgi:hypothetical protein